MRLPAGITSCVGFISHQQPTITYGGTAFIVGIEGSHDNAYLHLVTAARVAQTIENGPWLLGMNAKNGGKVWVRSGHLHWWHHPTEKEQVDVAVTIFATPVVNEYRLGWIPVNMFATDEQIEKSNIGIGDEISAIALFTRFSGQRNHESIARAGSIAMMPREPIPVKGFAPMEAYLAEGRSLGGLSGSPVFVRETINSPAADSHGNPYPRLCQGRIHFLGLMHGSWDVPAEFETNEQAEAVNMGVSVVVPAKKILEVLYHPELVEMRRQFDEELEASKVSRTNDVRERGRKQYVEPDFADTI
jgi:hypothetical protein